MSAIARLSNKVHGALDPGFFEGGLKGGSRTGGSKGKETHAPPPNGKSRDDVLAKAAPF